MKKIITGTLWILTLLVNLPLYATQASSRTNAQALVDNVIGSYPQLMVLGMHAVVPGQDTSTIIASNIGRIGKKDDEDDLEAFKKNTPIFEPVKDKHRYEVLIPMRQHNGKAIGVLGIVFKWNNEDEKTFLTTATRIRDDMQHKISSLDFLLQPASENTPLLIPAATVLIENSKGKFDFLEVDTINHVLLAAHEKDETSDFIDLNSNKLLARVKTGPAVHIALVPALSQYFVSDSSDKKVLVLDQKTLSKVGEILTEGELDAIVLDTKNQQLYVANDEGTHVYVIDPKAQKITATINIPSAPEYMVYDESSDKIYLNLKEENSIAVIDPTTNKVAALWPVAPATGPHGLAFNPIANHLYVAGANGKLVVIDSKTGKVIGSTSIVEKVDQNVFDPVTRRIYCAGPGNMSVIQETDTGIEFLGNVPTAETAKNVAVDPENHVIWTTFTDGVNSYAKSWRP
jgi:YVTN family beta-propeller protein